MSRNLSNRKVFGVGQEVSTFHTSMLLAVLGSSYPGPSKDHIVIPSKTNPGGGA